MQSYELPKDLPAPVNDGLANHLAGSTLAKIELISTDNTIVNIGLLSGLTVIYIYPMTGRPDVMLPDGWDAIPGARGCTPQSCAFKDHYSELRRLNCQVFGLSTQSSEYQQEAKTRLHLPFNLLCDSKLLLKQALALPTFMVNQTELYKRLTLIIENQKIIKVFYPVFPPDENAEEVIKWLESYQTLNLN